MKTLWSVSLRNTTKVEMKIYLTGTASEAKDGLIAEGKSKVFILPVGEKTYNYDDFKNGSAKWENKKKNYEEIIARTGNAPSGDYTFCVTAYDERGNEVGQENCIEHKIEILTVQEITLIQPGDGEKIESGKSPMFMWTPITPPPAEGYTLTIIEILGKESKEQAMKRTTTFFEQKNIRSTSFQYPVSGRKLEEGKGYAWMVSGGGVTSDIYTLKIIITDPSVGGCFQIDTSQYQVKCNGYDALGRPKYIINNLILRNIGTNPGRTGLNNTAATNYIIPTGFTILNLTPASATNILPLGSINISFELIGVIGNTADFIVNSTIVSPSNSAIFCDKTIGVHIDLPICICHDCDSTSFIPKLTIAPVAGNPNQYNISGSISITGLSAVYGIELQMQSYNYTATPPACSNGVTSIAQSGMFLQPATTINGTSAIQMFNETISPAGSGTNNNATKTIKLLSATPLPNSIPINLTVGLPGPITGLPSNCCKMDYFICIKVKVFYDSASCKSCTFNYCFPKFSNQ